MQRPVLAFGPFVLDPADFTLVDARIRVELQPRTFEVLRYLVENARRIVSRDELIGAVWHDVHVTDNTVDQALAKIRKALGDHERMLKTVPRRGWRLMVNVKRSVRGVPDPQQRPGLPAKVFGREGERAAIAQALSGPHQLVTLLGPGGIGKTTLARAVLDAWGERARFVDLAPCRTDVDVVSAVADALGVPAQRGAGPLGETLGHALARSGVTLLALDNVEQVTAAVGPLVTRWAEAAPAVRFLATSRERLGLRHERVLEIGPLPARDAAELLRARVEELDVGAAQDLPDADVLAVAEAVERVPLALELAATRLLAEEAAALAERLRSALLAPSGPTAHPDRQRSMSATIAWSWALLPSWARDAAEQLSVFRAPFEQALAEEVLDLPANAPAPLQVLGALRGRSLLSREVGDDGVLRFRALDAVRTYARDALKARGGATSADEAHARAVLGRMSPWDAYRGHSLPVRVRQTMRPLVPELQAVLDRALARADRTSAARAGLLLAKHFDAVGLHEACVRTLEQVGGIGDPWAERAAIAHAHAVSVVEGTERSQALLQALAGRVTPDLDPLVRLRTAQVRRDEGNPASPAELQALVDEAGDDDWFAAQAHQVRLSVAVRGAMDAGLVAQAEEGVALAERTDDEVLILKAHNQLFEVLHRLPDWPGAEAVLVRAMEFAEAFDLPLRVAGFALNLSTIRSDRGDHDGAWELLTRANDLAARVGDRNLVAFVHLRMGAVRSEWHRDLPGAREHLLEAHRLFTAIGRQTLAAGALMSVARAAAMLGAPEEALRCAREGLELAPADARVRWRGSLVRAIVALDRGDPSTVHASVAEARAALGEGHGHVVAELDAYDAVAFVIEGEDRARALGERVREAIGRIGPSLRWLGPLAQLATADPPDAGAPTPGMEQAWARDLAARYWSAPSR